jgi:hypothetical protein
MYVANALQCSGGYHLSSDNSGPDFFIKELNAWVECIAATNGSLDKADHVPDYRYLVKDDPDTYEAQDVPHQRVLLRYTAAFSEKEKKFAKYINNGLVQRNQPCIIAINAAKVNFSDIQIVYPGILPALFPIGDRYVTFNVETGEATGDGISHSASIAKFNLSRVEQTAFCSDIYSHISGILFSIQDAWTAEKAQPIGCDLVFVPNPFAENPVPERFLGVGSYCQIIRKSEYFVIQTLAV